MDCLGTVQNWTVPRLAQRIHRRLSAHTVRTITGKVKFKKKAASLVHGRVLRRLRECGIGHPRPKFSAHRSTAMLRRPNPPNPMEPRHSNCIWGRYVHGPSPFEPLRTTSKSNGFFEWMENFAGLQFLDSKQNQFQADRTYVRRCVHAIMTWRECTCQFPPFYTLRLDNLGAASLTVTRFANSFDAHREG
jgi:hypothetical protein